MNGAKNRIQMVLGIAICVILTLAGAVPQRYIPRRLNPVAIVQGRFETKPVRLPRVGFREREVTAKIWIKMDQGMCSGRLEKDTEVTGLFNVGEGHCLAQIPIGSALVLDPQANPGQYRITIGPEWHLLGPKGRRFVLLPMGVSIMVSTVLAGKLRSPVKKLGAKRLLFLLGVAVASGLIFYPVLHEGGHMIFGMLLGAKPDWKGVVWTCLSGQEPHASFSSLPPGAGPLMSAGGQILPTATALLLLVIWRVLSKNVSWYLSAALVWLPVLILLSSLGCLFELYQNSHMDALAVGLGLSGPLRVGFSLTPLFVTIAVYVWLGVRSKGASLLVTYEVVRAENPRKTLNDR